MKFVYILEDDPKFQQDITNALKFIDPKLQIRLFSKLEFFVSWLKIMMSEGAQSIAQGGQAPGFLPAEEVSKEEHQLVLIISKIEYLGARQLSLLKKTRNLFISKNICTKEDPTAIVLTAFENPNFKIRELEDRILNNIIFKPFDRLILTQHLIFAVEGRHPPSKNTIVNQKTSAIMEMLKDVSMESISEIGFISKSNRPIEVGSVSKYYGLPFKTERHKSLFGVCDRCDKHPINPEEYQIQVRFFAADPVQISNIRKKVRDPKNLAITHQWYEEDKINKKELNVIVIDPEESLDSGVAGTIKRKFKNCQVFKYTTFKDFILDLDPSQISSADNSIPKAFPTPEMIFIFDNKGLNILGFESVIKKNISIFSVTDKEIIGKANWCNNHLLPDHAEKLRMIFKGGKIKDDFFLWKVNDVSYLTRFQGLDQQKDGKIFIKFSEATKADWQDYLKANSKFPNRTDVIIFSSKFSGENISERWSTIQKQIINRGQNNVPDLFLLTMKDYSDSEERNLATFIKDIFFVPVEKGYFVSKFHYYYPFLEVQEEPIRIKTIPQQELLKVASPITVTEMSEAGFIMKYYRPISIGSFREMVLWQPYEIGAPEMLATCNYTEPSQGEKDSYNCHFVFFSTTDYFLKSIRVWIRDNYVLSKDKS